MLHFDSLLPDFAQSNVDFTASNGSCAGAMALVIL
jgi:hypothetical protein